MRFAMRLEVRRWNCGEDTEAAEEAADWERLLSPPLNWLKLASSSIWRRCHSSALTLSREVEAAEEMPPPLSQLLNSPLLKLRREEARRSRRRGLLITEPGSEGLSGDSATITSWMRVHSLGARSTLNTQGSNNRPHEVLKHAHLNIYRDLHHSILRRKMNAACAIQTPLSGYSCRFTNSMSSKFLLEWWVTYPVFCRKVNTRRPMVSRWIFWSGIRGLHAYIFTNIVRLVKTTFPRLSSFLFCTWTQRITAMINRT